MLSLPVFVCGVTISKCVRHSEKTG
jgi:hypothetical protein